MLLSLYKEILNEIFQYLHLRDIYRLRRTCNYLNSTIPLLKASKDIKCITEKPIPDKCIWFDVLPLLKNLKGYVVAGSQALQVLHNEFWEFSDLDIFFFNQTAEEFTTQAYHFFKKLCEVTNKFWSWETKSDINPDFRYYNTINLEQELKNCQDVYLIRLSGVYKDHPDYRRPSMKIDLVYTKYKTATEVMLDFDLDFCAVGFVVDHYDRCNFMLSSPECYQSAKDKKCTIYKSKREHSNRSSVPQIIHYISICSSDHNLKIDDHQVLSLRIQKYIKRGFSVEINHENPEGKRTIEDKEESRRKFVMKYTY